MKLSEYIEKMQKFLEENGDMNCFYAIDDEGNGYHKVHCAGTKMWTFSPEEYRADMYQDGELEDYDIDEDDERLAPVCIIN